MASHLNFGHLTWTWDDLRYDLARNVKIRENFYSLSQHMKHQNDPWMTWHGTCSIKTTPEWLGTEHKASRWPLNDLAWNMKHQDDPWMTWHGTWSIKTTPEWLGTEHEASRWPLCPSNCCVVPPVLSWRWLLGACLAFLSPLWFVHPMSSMTPVSDDATWQTVTNVIIIFIWK